MKPDELELERLLSRGHLSGRQYDEIESRVLGQVAPPRRRWKPVLFLPAAALLSLIAAAVMVRPATPSFRAKGGGSAVAAVDVGCGGATPRVCRAGSQLMFVVNTAVVSGYLAACAERSGDPAHERIWYFPNAAGQSPRIEPGVGSAVVPQAIRIGSEHVPGRYRITLWVTETAMARADLVQASALPKTSVDVEIVP